MLALVACGGGGGSTGTTASGTTTGTSATGDTQTAATASMTMNVLSGAGTLTNSISAIEISKVSITLKDDASKPVSGAVVTFAEIGSGLLTFAPASKTALTDASGVASVEIRAASATSVGATTVGATATVSGGAIAAQKAIAITSAPTGEATAPDPQALANALNFLDVNPADKSIVLAGAGGNGRSESATLRFRVVDKNNTPVKGATVTFDAVPSSDVTLNIPRSISDADGVVVTTVSSKSVATAVVIKATVTRLDTSVITSQSDQLLVTTGTSTLRGFDLSAGKYNLNFNLTGDSTTITVRIVDANGNPVADGVPVVFTAPFGAVGTSSKGGCVTVSGGCSVPYSVQNPRPNDGQRATVTASTQVGNGTSISDTLAFNFVDVNLLNLFNLPVGGVAMTEFYFPKGACGKITFSTFAGTPKNFPAPAGTTVTMAAITSDLAVALKSDSPILDQIAPTPSRTNLDIEVDLSTMVAPNSCATADTDTILLKAKTALFDVKFVASSISQTRRITVNYYGLP
ncbi:MAG: hypothetical protein JWP96_1965 [Polaromonas sp.]|nr:hypothetical protein [Polaromonas sp.]